MVQPVAEASARPPTPSPRTSLTPGAPPTHEQGTLTTRHAAIQIPFNIASSEVATVPKPTRDPFWRRTGTRTVQACRRAGARPSRTGDRGAHWCRSARADVRELSARRSRVSQREPPHRHGQPPTRRLRRGANRIVRDALTARLEALPRVTSGFATEPVCLLCLSRNKELIEDSEVSSAAGRFDGARVSAAFSITTIVPRGRTTPDSSGRIIGHYALQSGACRRSAQLQDEPGVRRRVRNVTGWHAAPALEWERT